MTLVEEPGREAPGPAAGEAGSGQELPQEDCWDTCSVTGALDMEATTAATEATTEAGAGEAAATTAAGVAAEAPGPGAERPRHHRQERGQLRASAAPGGDKYYIDIEYLLCVKNML